MIRDRKLPTVDNVDQWVAQNNAEEEAVSSRAEVEAIFHKGTEELIAALATLTPEDIGLTLQSGPEFTMEMTTLMNLPAWHCTLHAGQIDFLQTCWDDQVVHLAGK